MNAVRHGAAWFGFVLAALAGLPAQSKDLPAQSKGLPAQSKDLPAQSKGLPAQSKGLPAQSTARPAQEPAVLPLPATAAAAAATFQQGKGIPGLSIAIATPAGVRAQGFGLADLENDVPASAETVYRLGSISKPVTAVAVLQLAAQQKLALDGDVRTWVPEFPAKQWPVTLRQLLGHLGGVRHYMRGETESTRHYESQRAGLGRFADDPLLHEPGTKYLYSTYGYNLLAAAVEAASGQTFGAYVRAHIAGPAGAPTLQDDDVVRLIKHRAQGYERQGDTLQNSELMDGSYKLGGGGLCSNAPDLARFGLALLDGRLLPPASLQTMTTVQATKDGTATPYGCGLRIGTRDGRAEWQHGGAQSRVSTVLVLLPEAKVAVAVLCNLEGVRPLELAQQIADQAAVAESRR